MLCRTPKAHGRVRPRAAAAQVPTEIGRHHAERPASGQRNSRRAGRACVKLFSVLSAIVGLTLIAALVAYFGVGAVTRPLVAVGWTGFSVICLIHLALIAFMGIAWGALLPGTSLWVPIWGRLVRDSGSELLPLSQVGGYVLGARAVTLAGVSGTSATASTIVDVTLELFGQLAYTALALSWLFYLRPDAAIAAPIAVGLALAGLLAVAFLAVQRRGFDLFDRFAHVRGRGPCRLQQHLWTARKCLGQFFAPSRLLDRQYARSVARAALCRRTARLCDGAGDREPALRCAQCRLCRSERGRGAGGSLYSPRRQLWPDPGDGAGSLPVEAGARSDDRAAYARRMAAPRKQQPLASSRLSWADPSP